MRRSNEAGGLKQEGGGLQTLNGAASHVALLPDLSRAVVADDGLLLWRRPRRWHDGLPLLARCPYQCVEPIRVRGGSRDRCMRLCRQAIRPGAVDLRRRADDVLK